MHSFATGSLLFVVAATTASAGMVIDGFTAPMTLTNTNAETRVQGGICGASGVDIFGGCRDIAFWSDPDAGTGSNTLRIQNGDMAITAGSGNWAGAYLVYDGNLDTYFGGSIDVDLTSAGNAFELYFSSISWDAGSQQPTGTLFAVSTDPFRFPESDWQFKLPASGTDPWVRIPFSSAPTWTTDGGADLRHIRGLALSLNQDTSTTGLQATLSSFEVGGSASPVVPEPCTLAIVGTGLVAAGLIRRRMPKLRPRRHERELPK